ncbi:anaerobic ribonucleoside-triphosphate reductase activating protein [Candidatus Desantisbacteria bacterium CG2_30_40_21]|uniref:Anaerobic ribonucleoside-triphosphate reductase activating protein n=3 Tax=unclassified Candidatus Desantisiibacteriota TaxID=3106372 RepID=A0A2M7JB88_9BACT|nr:MAG: anaerobic ribonucleoside-triphosphate reductase activating protein [Candidatus Desantisbacteria bacterium CG2_30_40_21]PIX16700.1 MAG: anaerobic ribonucleoside-triphosphate reductase activating protein [Candidatus Desantisbacteria bacterium CG_4_8_14_3_um_filter_40_12]PIY19641.1 MAG: anaerobic ribonucleoside-triphosphate reductase activating protein [Candidatus Desantisbacteria bacterium CG_4_10_14_3_um_filter_40_18]
MTIIIKGFIEMSMLDWEGKIVSTLYLPNCNLRCPYCHNSGLVINPEQYDTIPFETVRDYLMRQQGWIDGVCISGGEPCLYEDLPDFIRGLRNAGALIKLDTNGSFPDMLQRLFDERLIDYIAMDIKAPLNTYALLTGIRDEAIEERIKQSIRIIMNSGIDYEFRTTVVPTLHTKEILVAMAGLIRGAKKYALQAFVPNNPIDPEYRKITPYSDVQMQDMQQAVLSYVQRCVLRGV